MTELRVGGRYRHYKNKEYVVLGTAKHSETLEDLVVYQAQYGDNQIWVRPYEMFLEDVKVEGKMVPRFREIG
ncbi:DUF1653 domain-containing protein [Candidatus Saccharibacteria bacterium]|nr:DUF1653 domain-containing protein [Candidatus Saccharibacteria bacterium]